MKRKEFNCDSWVHFSDNRAQIYNRHLNTFLETYQKQNRLTRITAFTNPYSAILHLSMALSGTDFDSYVSFQNQAESYRYHLAQEMNELQMEFISNIKPGPDDKLIPSAVNIRKNSRTSNISL